MEALRNLIVLFFAVATIVEVTPQLEQIYLVGQNGVRVINLYELLRLAPRLTSAGNPTNSGPDKSTNQGNQNNLGHTNSNDPKSSGNPNFPDKSRPRSFTPTAPNVCVTPGCVKIAAFMIESVDQTVNPCEDFYNFTCGGYLSRTIVPDDKASVSVFSKISDHLDQRMRIVLEQKINATDSNSTIMAKHLYKSCMNTTAVEEDGLQPLRDILDDLGGWPVLQNGTWNASNFSITDILYKSHKYGFSIDTLFSFEVEVDDRNSSRRIIMMDQVDLGLDREHLIYGLEDPVVKAYLEYAKDVAELLGADEDTAEAEMNKMLAFEMQLANISIPKEERRNFTVLYNIMSLKELQDLTPQIPWLEFMNKILPSPVKVSIDEKIDVIEPPYYRDLNKLLSTIDNRTLANYMIWRVIKEAASYLSYEITELEFEFLKELEGESEGSPRWQECVGLVQYNLPYAIGNLYVKHYFNKEAKTTIKTMVQYLMHTFKDILKSVDWMDETTRARALEKADAIQTNIAYPDELMMDNKLDEYYGNLSIDEGSLFWNILRINAFGNDQYYGLLRQKVDKTDWKLQASVAEVNAFYSTTENSITFPAGILQGAIFDSTFPQYVNYGGIGEVIGHEITHGFDDQGRQFDGNGNLNNWWQPETGQKYQEKAKCIVDQYTGYTMPENGLRLNGVNSQGEDIADNGGTRESYIAYQKWVQDNGPELGLPGLPFNNNQLFWISVAMKYCEKSRPEHLRQQILTDEHTPNRFRAIGPLSNSPEFAKDFNCPVGSVMNPIHRCTVW